MNDLAEAKVTQSNRLVEAAHTLTLNEKRLVLACVSQLDPRKPLPKDGVVRLRAEEFANVFGMDTRHAYEALADASTRLYNRDIRRYGERGKIVERMRWVYHVKYHEGEGYVVLGFSPTVVPYLTLLHREFTTYQLKQIGALPSFYAIRLYELLMQFRKTGERDIPLDRLRTMLDLGDKYPNVKDLRRWVLDPALKEINTHTDLRVAMSPQRKGRLIIGFHFDIVQDDQMALPL